jgi:hypothetical protein
MVQIEGKAAKIWCGENTDHMLNAIKKPQLVGVEALTNY